jgi:hypothetical protein
MKLFQITFKAASKEERTCQIIEQVQHSYDAETQQTNYTFRVGISNLSIFFTTKESEEVKDEMYDRTIEVPSTRDKYLFAKIVEDHIKRWEAFLATKIETFYL